MRVWLTLVRRELAGYFVSWTGYVVIAVVAFLFGLSFFILLNQMNLSEADMPLTELFYDKLALFLWLILLLASPLITMRTFAHEKFSGTFETLMTTPVSDLQVVLAKFFGACDLRCKPISNEVRSLPAAASTISREPAGKR